MEARSLAFQCVNRIVGGIGAKVIYGEDTAMSTGHLHLQAQ